MLHLQTVKSKEAPESKIFAVFFFRKKLTLAISWRVWLTNLTTNNLQDVHKKQPRKYPQFFIMNSCITVNQNMLQNAENHMIWNTNLKLFSMPKIESLTCSDRSQVLHTCQVLDTGHGSRSIVLTEAVGLLSEVFTVICHTWQHTVTALTTSK